MRTTYTTRRFALLSLCCLMGLSAIAQVQTSTLEYWTDQRFDERQSLPITGELEQTLNVSQLSSGIHTIGMRVSDTKGRWGAPLIRYFLKSNIGLAGNALASYQYCIDGNWAEAVSGTFEEGKATVDIDISRLRQGLHTLLVRVNDLRGQQSQTLLKHFLALGEDVTQRQLTAYRYWIDSEANSMEGQTVDGNIVLDIDVSNLTFGLHMLCYQVADNMGRLSAPRLLYFVKPYLETGSDRIVAYEYWFNQGARHRLELDPAVTFSASDLLIEVKDVVPNHIPDDYTFLSTSETVTLRDDVYFGLQVFNGAGKGSLAVMSETVNIPLTIAPQFLSLADGDSIAFEPPVGGHMQGFKTETMVGDTLVYRLADGNMKADFFDADGKTLTPEKTMVEDGAVIYNMVSQGGNCFALLYNATTGNQGIALSISHNPQVTGIGHTALLNNRATIYDLQGRKRTETKKGIYVIDGKKKMTNQSK